jgi:ABC-type nitrate/sulfonate/bicarbonate transport system substrate-binding protein
MTPIRQILFVPPAPLVWADALAEPGAPVETTVTTSSDEIGRGLAAGRFDIGIGVMDNAIGWTAEFGAEVAILAQLEARMHLRFLAAERFADLAAAAAEPIAVDTTTNGFVMVLYRALARAGIDRGNCRFDLVGGVKHRLEALMTGHATATILVPPFDAIAVASGHRVLWDGATLAPAYPGVVVVARRAWMAAAPDAVRAHLHRLSRANDWARAPAHRAAAIAALVGARYTPEAAAALVDTAVPDLRPSQAGWDETVALRTEAGFAPTPSAEAMIDSRFLP